MKIKQNYPIEVLPVRVKEKGGVFDGKFKTELYQGKNLIAVIPPQAKQPRKSRVGQNELTIKGWNFRLNWSENSGEEQE